MKNKMNKFTKILIALIMMITGVSSTVSNVNAAPGTITVGSTEAIPKLIGQTYFASMRTTDGNYAYCLDINKTTVSNQTMTLAGEKDAGVSYLLQNGYPARNITGNRVYDIYITQTALWWYLDNTTGSHNLGNGFKTSASDPHGLRPHIQNLVNGAMNARNQGYPNVTVSINNGNQTLKLKGLFYESDPMSVSGSNFTSYKVTMSGAPKAASVANLQNQAKDTFAPNEQFKILISAAAVNVNELSIQINVTASGTVYKAYEYVPSNSVKYQNVVSSVLQPVGITANTSTTAKIKKESKIEIIKVDKSTQKPLAGAKFTLKDSNNKTIRSWDTTTEKYVINNLPDGTYKLYEVVAPAGYKRITVPITFKIDATNRSKVIKVENTEEGSNISITKIDKDTKKAIAGATLVLKNTKGTTIDTWKSTTSSHTIKDLADGTYTVEELEAPKGYKKSTKKVTISVNKKKQKSYSVNFENEEEKAKLSIIKIDKDTKKAVAGAKLVLKDSTGKVIESWTSTLKAHVVTDLEDGEYSIEEIAAPKGYKKIQEVTKVVIENKKSKSVTVKVENEAKQPVVNIVKIDSETKNPLAGAVLVVKNSKGKVIAKWTTTEDPYVLLDLEDGTYTVEELEAPNGYEKSNEVIKFTIDDNHLSHQITFENKPVPTETVFVPNTSSFASLLKYILGLGFVASAVGFIYKNGKKAK